MYLIQRTIRTLPMLSSWIITVLAVWWALSHHQFVARFPLEKGVPWWSIFPWQAITTPVAALIVFFGGYGLYTKQKVWERRLQEYTKAVDAVSTLQEETTLLLRDKEHDLKYPQPTTFFKDRITELSTNAFEARNYIDTVAIGGSFILSEASQAAIYSARLAIYATVKDSCPEDYAAPDDWIYFFVQEQAIYTKCISALNECAAKDLGINASLTRRLP